MSSQTLRHWIERLPKAELHLHLEGAIPLPALLGLIEKYGGDPAIGSLEDLRRRLTYADFPSFIETWIWKNGFLREYEDFTAIAAPYLLKDNPYPDLAALSQRCNEMPAFAETVFKPG